MGVKPKHVTKENLVCDAQGAFAPEYRRYHLELPGKLIAGREGPKTAWTGCRQGVVGWSPAAMLRAATAATSLSITCVARLSVATRRRHRPLRYVVNAFDAAGIGGGTMRMAPLWATWYCRTFLPESHAALPKPAEMAVKHAFARSIPISISANRPPQPMLAPRATVFTRWTAGRCVKTICRHVAGPLSKYWSWVRGLNRWPHIAHHRNATWNETGLAVPAGAGSAAFMPSNGKMPPFMPATGKTSEPGGGRSSRHISGPRYRGRFAEPCCRVSLPPAETRTPVPCNHCRLAAAASAGRQVQRQRRHPHAGTRHGSQPFQPQATRSWAPKVVMALNFTVELIFER